MDFISMLKGLVQKNKSPVPPVQTPSKYQYTNYGHDVYENKLAKLLPDTNHPMLRTTTPTPTPDVKQWDNFKEYVAKTAAGLGYNPGAVVGQKALESARGQSEFAKERNNYGGIGAYDSNPNEAFSFQSPEDYTDYYFKMIQKRFPKAYENRGNPTKYIQELKKANYATDPEYVWKVTNTPEYREYVGKKYQANR